MVKFCDDSQGDVVVCVVGVVAFIVAASCLEVGVALLLFIMYCEMFPTVLMEMDHDMIEIKCCDLDLVCNGLVVVDVDDVDVVDYREYW